MFLQMTIPSFQFVPVGSNNAWLALNTEREERKGEKSCIWLALLLAVKRIGRRHLRKWIKRPNSYIGAQGGSSETPWSHSGDHLPDFSSFLQPSTKGEGSARRDYNTRAIFYEDWFTYQIKRGNPFSLLQQLYLIWRASPLCFIDSPLNLNDSFRNASWTVKY